MSTDNKFWLPEEIVRIIALKLPLERIISYAVACNFPLNRIFWIEKIIHDCEVSAQYIAENDDGETPEDLYIKIAAYTGHAVPGVDKYGFERGIYTLLFLIATFIIFKLYYLIRGITWSQ